MKFALSVLLYFNCLLGYTQDTVRLVIDYEQPKGTISDMLTGSHFVYAFENDKLYKDDRIKDWMIASDVNVIRWPGGTVVQHYHWDDLNGIPFKQDSWDPDYDEAYKSEKDFMDLDEYIAFCMKVGATPMVGVNIRSGMVYKRDSLGLAEAKNLIKYCKDKGYKVPYWYIGNEGYATGFDALKYARYLDKYASVLKSVDSTITIIGDWKFGPIKKARFLESIDIIKNSKHIDIMEYHEKWGNTWGLMSGQSYDDWKTQFPIYNGKLTEYIIRFHELMDAIGRTDVQIAFNEWGLGYVKNADEFEHALVAADYLIELFKNDVAQACYWNLNIGSKVSRVLKTSENGKRLLDLNPISGVFELLAPAQGQKLLHVESNERSLYGFACQDDDGAISLYLLNKSDNQRKIDIVQEPESSTIELAEFCDAGNINNKVVLELSELILAPWTLNRITFQ